MQKKPNLFRRIAQGKYLHDFFFLEYLSDIVTTVVKNHRGRTLNPKISVALDIKFILRSNLASGKRSNIFYTLHFLSRNFTLRKKSIQSPWNIRAVGTRKVRIGTISAQHCTSM
jgi:hypothetical protein